MMAKEISYRTLSLSHYYRHHDPTLNLRGLPRFSLQRFMYNLVGRVVRALVCQSDSREFDSSEVSVVLLDSAAY